MESCASGNATQCTLIFSPLLVCLHSLIINGHVLAHSPYILSYTNNFIIRHARVVDVGTSYSPEDTIRFGFAGT